ncbi:MAG: glycosyltransferase family 39 protein [Bdellovibrionales bacterium]|nr:glycosyltransferase family 39 protein [Bdellovibrionales bacterium]
MNELKHLGLQPDERLWVVRSSQLAVKLKNKRKNATTHLGHPGIPPATVMAASQLVAEKINLQNSVTEGDASYIYKLDASRFGNTIVSSIVFPLLLYTINPILGFETATLTSFLFALDPEHIGCSRMAHLDSILTLLVTCCILLYVFSIRNASVPTKLLAGVFWGLSVATKPTAASLVVIFVLYKIIRFLLAFKNKRNFDFITWSDIWAVIVGHIFFALIYTRLWDHFGDYRVRLGITTPVARFLWRRGNWLANEVELLVAISSLLLILAVYLYRKFKITNSKISFHLSMLLFLIIFFSTSLAAFPVVYENFSRFWTWAIGLSKVAHVSFENVALEPPPGGYLALFFTRLPLLVLLGCFFSIFASVHYTFQEKAKEKASFLIFCFLAVIFWSAVLSVSPKQTFRYILPILPLIYIFSAAGFVFAIKRIIGFANKKSFSKHLSFSVISLLIIIQAFNVLSWNPHYTLFYNPLMGGLAGAMERGQPLGVSGEREAIEFLVKKAQEKNHPVYVSVLGDSMALEYMIRKEFPHANHLLNFGYFRPYSSDYLLSFGTAEHREMGNNWLLARAKPPVLTYEFKNVTMMTLREVPTATLPANLSFPAFIAHSRTGKFTIDTVKNLKVLELNPELHTKNHVFFIPVLKVKAGKYRFVVNNKIIDQTLSKNKPLLKIDISKRCQKQFYAYDSDTSILCSFKKDTRLHPRVFWAGKVHTQFEGIGVETIIEPKS